MRIIKFLLLTIIISGAVALGGLGWVYYKVSTPHNADVFDTQTIIIERGESFASIVRNLQEEEIIAGELYMTVYATLEKKTGRMQAGVYELSPSMSIKNIIEMISGGRVVDGAVRVTFPEGFSNAQIGERLSEEGIIDSAAEFINLAEMSASAASGLYDYPFLRSSGAFSLHGFLFPDTYEFRAPQEAREVLDKFLANFQQKAGHIFAPGGHGGSGQATSYSPYDILIMASILEKEVQTDEDMQIAAGVLYNRLEIGMPLQVDATLVYITGKVTGQLTNTDKQIDHPFNTYRHRGLPPGPIANPGLRAINAALNPLSTEYFYYLSAPDGTTHFSRTLEEHNEKKARYLR